MDITAGFEPVVGGSSPSGRTRKQKPAAWLLCTLVRAGALPGTGLAARQGRAAIDATATIERLTTRATCDQGDNKSLRTARGVDSLSPGFTTVLGKTVDKLGDMCIKDSHFMA